MSMHMVNVLSDTYDHLCLRRPGRRRATGPSPTELRTRLVVEAWVRNVAFVKDVWVEVTLVDVEGEAVRGERLDLDYLGPGEGAGDRFGVVHDLPSPGPFPDGRRLQYRLFYRVNDDVFTDGVLHEHPLPAPEVPAEVERV
ncbi:MAG: hypothetical protein ACRDY7_11295 [Acidimicrobiia bacterium]